MLYGQQLQPAVCPVFINVCASSQVQPILLRHNKQPATADDIQIMSGLLIPLSVGKQRTETSDSSLPVTAAASSSSSVAFNYDCLRALTAALPSSLPPPPVPSPASPAHVYDVVFNPATLSAASRSLPLLLSLVQLCVSHIQEDHPAVGLHQQLIPVLGLRYRGRQQQQQSEQSAAAASKLQTKAASAAGSREIVLPAAGKADTATAITELKLREEKETDNRRGRAAGRPLIEEVGEEEAQGAATAAGSGKAVPQYEERYDDAAGEMQMDVLLPEVREMSEVSVELGERQLQLSSSAYALTVRLQRAVDEDSCVAKWSRKRRRLTLKARLRRT